MELSQIDQDRELLLQHARHPLRSGDVTAFEHRGVCKNPLCGDAVEVGLELNDGVISKLRIQTNGCGISIASSSLMTELAEGQTREAALAVLENFNTALTSSPKTEWPPSLTMLRPFSRLRESPTRVPCALIGWFALKSALKVPTSLL